MGYAVGETLASPVLLFGNIMASEATLASLGSDILSGDTGLDLSVVADNKNLQVNGEVSIGTGSTVGIITTMAGWIPALPSYASLGLQSIAVSNDLGVGQKLGILDGTSYVVPISLSYSSHLPFAY